MCRQAMSSYPMWQVDRTSGQKQLTIFTIHGPRTKFSNWSKMFAAEIEDATPAQWYFPVCKVRQMKTSLLDWLRDAWFMAGLQKQLPQKQTIIQRSVSREWVWQHDEREEATKYRAEKKDEHNGRFQLFLHTGFTLFHQYHAHNLWRPDFTKIKRKGAL